MKRTSFILCVSWLALAGAAEAQRPRLPRIERLDAGVELRRDRATGELIYARKGGSAVKPQQPAAGGATAPGSTGTTIRVQVNLRDISFNVLDAEGRHLRGLTGDDVRLVEKGEEQSVVHFDAATEPARVVLLFDSSPSVFREAEEMKAAARRLAEHLDPGDEVAVVDFAGSTRLRLPFTADRALLDRAIESIHLERGQSSERGSEIYRSVYLVAQELFAGDERRGRRSVVLLTDGQDTGLDLGWAPNSMLPRGADDDRLTFEDLLRALTMIGVEVHVVSMLTRPRAMTEAWLASRQRQPLVTAAARDRGMPHYTLFLAELVRRAGGQLYFLREIGTLGDVYARIAENLRAQYTLGYYPVRDAAPGWREIRITVPGRDDLRFTHRVAYYVPARK